MVRNRGFGIVVAAVAMLGGCASSSVTRVVAVKGFEPEEITMSEEDAATVDRMVAQEPRDPAARCDYWKTKLSEVPPRREEVVEYVRKKGGGVCAQTGADERVRPQTTGRSPKVGVEDNAIVVRCSSSCGSWVKLFVGTNHLVADDEDGDGEVRFPVEEVKRRIYVPGLRQVPYIGVMVGGATIENPPEFVELYETWIQEEKAAKAKRDEK